MRGRPCMEDQVQTDRRVQDLYQETMHVFIELPRRSSTFFLCYSATGNVQTVAKHYENECFTFRNSLLRERFVVANENNTTLLSLYRIRTLQWECFPFGKKVFGTLLGI